MWPGCVLPAMRCAESVLSKFCSVFRLLYVMNDMWSPNYHECGNINTEVCVVCQVASYDAIALPALHVWEVMRRIKGTTHGLAPTFLDPNNGESASFGSNHVTLGARGDSYYEYAFDLPFDLYKSFCLHGQ